MNKCFDSSCMLWLIHRGWDSAFFTGLMIHIGGLEICSGDAHTSL